MRTSRTRPKLTIFNGNGTLVLCTIFVLLCLPKNNFSNREIPSAYKVNTVVIDAGHGGHDPGAIGASLTKEKNVSLAVALKLGGYIEEYFPDVKVVYTREKDEFIELHERANIANKSNADLFISVHCNKFESPSVHGTEVYVLGLHKTEENLAVAKRENSVILMEDDYNQQYDGFEPGSPEAHILFSMFQNAFLEQSIGFAERVDQQFKERVNRNSRGVKQAGFMVLYRTAMPAALIELGFISNKNEESFLTTEQGQSYMASAIYRAFKEYKIDMEKHGPGSPGVSEATNVVPHPANNKPDPVVEEKKETPAPKTETKETTKPVKEETKPAPAVKNAEKVVFKIQFLASDKELPLNDPALRELPDIAVVQANGLYKYLSGNFTSYDEAMTHQSRVRDSGFKGAFMVAYQGYKRITIQEALKLKE